MNREITEKFEPKLLVSMDINQKIISALIFVILIGMMFISKEEGREGDMFYRSSIFCCNTVLFIAMALTSYCLFLIDYFSLPSESYFFVAVIFLSVLFAPYLKKASKHQTDPSIKVLNSDSFERLSHDVLVVTSLIYGVAAVYAFLENQLHMSFLCAMTCIGSTIYHLHRESSYFNFDNIFAMSQLQIFCWSLYLSFGVRFFEYFIVGCISLPVVGFLLVYSGDPAEIEYDKENNRYHRKPRSIYDTVHLIWHIVSGCGPVLAIWLFGHRVMTSSLPSPSPDSSLLYSIPSPIMGSHLALDKLGAFPIIPVLSILFSIVLNIIANYHGVVPFD